MTARPRNINRRIAAQGVRLAGAGIVLPPESPVAGSQGFQRPDVLSDTGGVGSGGATGRLTLILLDFPAPSLARVLSPNGRAHFGTQIRAKKEVREHLLAALSTPPASPLTPPVHVTYRWVLPIHRKRDFDNHGTGVIKVVQDWLVKRGVLVGDDSSVLTSRTEIVVERGHRRLEIEITPAVEDV